MEHQTQAYLLLCSEGLSVEYLNIMNWNIFALDKKKKCHTHTKNASVNLFPHSLWLRHAGKDKEQPEDKI